MLFSPLPLYSEVVSSVRELLQLKPVHERVEGGWTQAGWWSCLV